MSFLHHTVEFLAEPKNQSVSFEGLLQVSPSYHRGYQYLACGHLFIWLHLNVYTSRNIAHLSKRLPSQLR